MSNDKQTLTDTETAAPIVPAPLIGSPLDRMREELASTELIVLTGYTLADAIREGSGVSEQYVGGWAEGDKACALSAARIAAKARGYVN